MNKALVIMAAGLGARYGGVKQIDPVGPGGEILMEYAMYDALRAGFDRLIAVVQPGMPADCDARFGARVARASGVPVEYALQPVQGAWADIPISARRTKPLGTVHALLCARPLLDRPFAVINADDDYGSEAFALMADALGALGGGESAMVAYRLANTLSPHGAVTRGVCTAAGALLEAVTETYDVRQLPDGAICGRPAGGAAVALAPDTPVSMNFWGFRPELLPRFDAHFRSFLRALAPEDDRSECLLPVVMDALISAGETKTRLLRTDGRWFGLTHRADRPGVAAALRARHASGRYPPTLWGSAF